MVSIKKNFLMNIILTTSSLIFPLITFPYVSRVLTPVGLGKVSFATSFISYFSMFAQLGIPTYGIIACARVRDNREELTRTTHELLAINIIMDVVSYIALAIALVTVPRLIEDRILYFVISFTIILTSIGMEWLYKALEQYTYITIRSILFKFIALIAMLTLIHSKEDYIIYGGISIFAASASNILNFVNIHRYIDLKPVGGYNLLRHLKPVGTFFAMTCAVTIYSNMDTVMLGFMKSDQEVGYYNAAVKIKQILISIVTSLGSVLLPRVSYYIEKGKNQEFKRITIKALNFVFLVATPMTVYFMLYAKIGIYFLSGNAYANSIVPMRIIMPTVLIVGLSNILGIQVLVPLGKEKIVLFSEVLGTAVNLLINALLIPKLASSGAAIGTVAAEFMVLIVQYIALKDDIKHAFESVSYIRISGAILAGTVLSAISLILKKGNFITLVISATLFFSAYGLVLLFTKEKLTIEIFNQVVRKILKKK